MSVRAKRIYLTLSTEMTVALDILASREELEPATKARALLRQALSQTIRSEECQTKVRRLRSEMGAGAWREHMAGVADDMRVEEQERAARDTSNDNL